MVKNVQNIQQVVLGSNKTKTIIPDTNVMLYVLQETLSSPEPNTKLFLSNLIKLVQDHSDSSHIHISPIVLKEMNKNLGKVAKGKELHEGSKIVNEIMDKLNAYNGCKVMEDNLKLLLEILDEKLRDGSIDVTMLYSRRNHNKLYIVHLDPYHLISKLHRSLFDSYLISYGLLLLIDSFENNGLLELAMMRDKAGYIANISEIKVNNGNYEFIPYPWEIYGLYPSSLTGAVLLSADKPLINTLQKIYDVYQAS